MSDSSESDSDSDNDRTLRRLSSVNRFNNTKYVANDLSPREEKLRKLEEFERTPLGHCLKYTAYLIQLACLPVTCPCLTCYLYFFNEELNDDEDTHNAGSYNVSNFVFRRKSNDNDQSQSGVRNLLSGIRFKKGVRSVIKKEIKPARISMMSATKITVAAANEGLIDAPSPVRKATSLGGGFLAALKQVQAKKGNNTGISEGTDEDDSADEVTVAPSSSNNDNNTGKTTGSGNNGGLLNSFKSNTPIAPEITEIAAKKSGVNFSTVPPTLDLAKSRNHENSKMLTTSKTDVIDEIVNDSDNGKKKGDSNTPMKSMNTATTPKRTDSSSNRNADSESKDFSPVSSPVNFSSMKIAVASSPSFKAPSPSPAYIKSISNKYTGSVQGPTINDL